MEYANIFQRALAFVLDLLILRVLLMAIGATVLAPLAMVAAMALGSEWGWEGWGWGMSIVIVPGSLLVTYIYLVRGWTGRGTPGHRWLGLALVRMNGSAPNLRQATLRYLAGFLVPLALPILIDVFAEGVWRSRHAAREPKLQTTSGRLTISPDAVLAHRLWEEDGRRARGMLTRLFWFLYGSELVLMALAIALHPQRRGWHDRLAGTLVIRRKLPGSSS